MASLGRVKRVRVPRQMLIPTRKGKHHDEVVYEGVYFTLVKSIRFKCKMDCIKNQFSGFGYSTKRGVINLQFDDEAPPPPPNDGGPNICAHSRGYPCSEIWSQERDVAVRQEGICRYCERIHTDK